MAPHPPLNLTAAPVAPERRVPGCYAQSGRVLPSGPAHRPEHTNLTPELPRVPVTRAVRAVLDGIVVPSGRDLESTATARDLAEALGIPVILLRSDVTSPADAKTCLGGATGAVATVPRDLCKYFFGLQLAEPWGGADQKFVHTAFKRNAGLRIGRRLGWRTMLFLDDDVRGLDPDQLLGAAQAMRANSFRAAAYLLDDFPDNSVVCHLRREVDLPQGISAGGAALLVDLDGELPFFPPVYNEDWLFLRQWTAEGLVARAGRLSQEPYEPFADPDRARREEFGDVLAEGLFELIQRGRGVEVAQSWQLWAEVLRARWSMLLDIGWRISGLAPGPEQRLYQHSWLAAWNALQDLRGHHFSTFVRLWQADQEQWNLQLDLLTKPGDLAEVLWSEGLSDVFIGA